MRRSCPAGRMAPLLTGMDTVVHLAGIAHIGPDVSRRRPTTASIAWRPPRSRAPPQRPAIRRFVFISSIRAQSGPHADRAARRETDPPQPTDAYGRSKLAAEEAVRASGRAVHDPAARSGLWARREGQSAPPARLARLPWPLPFRARSRTGARCSRVDNLIAAIRFALEDAARRKRDLSSSPIRADQRRRDRRAMRARRPVAGRSLVPVPPRAVRVPYSGSSASGDMGAPGRQARSPTGQSCSRRLAAGTDTRTALDRAWLQAASPRKSGTASRSTP